ncbi:hypothetical protein CCYA_CCYA03G1035 [Cyanidiococcus yangmingshanensis]|nr:hypothetical protein CCYA_CCYA03G1035 [Cyanidiococcus yangmingshanensis]
MSAERFDAPFGPGSRLQRTDSVSCNLEIRADTRRAGTLQSALEYANELLKFRSKVAFLLDYDGTLTQIVEDPDGAVLEEHVRDLLCMLSRKYPVAIITGRSREKIMRLVGISGIYYAGSHGFDIEIPVPGHGSVNHAASERQQVSDVTTAGLCNGSDGSHSRYHIAAEVVPVLHQAARQLRSIFGIEDAHVETPAASWPLCTPIAESKDNAIATTLPLGGVFATGSTDKDSILPLPIQPEPASPPSVDPSILSQIDKLLSSSYPFRGVSIEDNHLSISVHYRRCDPAHVPTIEKIVDSVAYRFGLRKTRGKCVFELRPAVKWDKGRAAKWLLEMIEMREERHCLPVYIGDDVTDEDAMKLVSNHGGFGVIVTEDDSRETSASLRLRDPVEVAHFLERFLNTREHELESAAA